jgi:hypothetical protein
VVSETYEGEAMKRIGVSEWHKWFKEGHKNMENEDNAHHFFDVKGTVHFEFIPQGQTLNQIYYMEVLKWLHEAVHRKRPALGPRNGFSTVTMLQLTRFSL